MTTDLVRLLSAWVVAQAPAAPVPQAISAPDYGFWSSVMGAGLGEKCVMAVLLGFSVVSWAIIVHKARLLRRAVSESEAFLDAFWGTKRLDAIYQKAEQLTASPISQVFRAGYVELAKLRKKTEAQEGQSSSDDHQLGDLESIARSMKRAMSTEMAGLEALVPFLGTTASTAPFIGLFGTVVGIIGAFRDIGLMGNANLATVAPGVGGALVATAFGLFAAIPAVIGYNFFVAKLRVIDTEMNNFSADFLNIIKRHFF